MITQSHMYQKENSMKKLKTIFILAILTVGLVATSFVFADEEEPGPKWGSGPNHQHTHHN